MPRKSKTSSSKRSAPRESLVVNRLIGYLRSRGAFAEKIHGDAFQSVLLDILVCYRGRFMLLEVKRGSSYGTTPLQEYTMEQVRRAGGVSIRVDSIEDVAFLLDEVDAYGSDGSYPTES